MRRPVIVDTGPLVAFLNRRDTYHRWAAAQWAQLQPPLLTCEAVLSEACFLLKGPAGGEAVMELLRRRVLAIAFRLDEEGEPVAVLLRRFSSLPMSLADACLVRMSERHARAVVLTLDSDFKIYRRHGRQVIPTIMPDGV